MLRCFIAGLTLAVSLASPATAQVQRQFPQSALRGQMIFVNPPEVRLNGAAVVLAPGSRIRGQNNMLEMSGTLTGSKLWVHYTMDTQGSVDGRVDSSPGGAGQEAMACHTSRIAGLAVRRDRAVLVQALAEPR